MKKKIHLVPHLRRAPGPPTVVVIEGWCESVTVKQQLLHEELTDRCLDRFLGGFREQKFHINLTMMFSTTLSRVKRFRTIFSVSS